MRKRTVFYMSVEADEYELPVYLAETVEELAEKYGISKNTIYSSISLNRGSVKSSTGRKFVKVKL